MLLLRSLIFSLYLYGVMAVIALVMLPAVLIWGEGPAMWAARQWSRAGLFGVRIICGIRYDLRGRENLPAGNFLVASKHQASWETLLFATLFAHPAIVFKKELRSFPLYGWYLDRAGMICVDRDQGGAALKALLRAGEAKAASGHQVIIFPEGTRQAPSAAPDYKPGVAALYSKLGLPCVPIALNSGLYWEGKGLLRRAGTIRIEILAPILPGLRREEFMKTLEDRIETASNRLLAEAKAAL